MERIYFDVSHDVVMEQTIEKETYAHEWRKCKYNNIERLARLSDPYTFGRNKTIISDIFVQFYVDVLPLHDTDPKIRKVGRIQCDVVPER